MYKTTVRIDGMMCSMCEAHINDAIRKKFPKAKKVRSSHTKNQAEFLTEEEIDPAVLSEAIEETGYHFLSAEAVPYEKKGMLHRLM